MSTFVVSCADAGDFAGGRLAWDVLHAAARHRTVLPDVIDLSNCVMLKPYAVACLAALGAKKENGIEVRVPADPRCADHLSRLGLGRWLRGGWIDDAARRATNIVARQVLERPETLSDEIIRTLVGEMDLASNIAHVLANHLDEVLLNALTHADSPIGAMAVGQAFPRERALEIAILDLGQTIRAHLCGNPKNASVATDSEAIIRATEEGISGTVGTNRWGDPNSGVGLFELRRYCERGARH